ncbi:MAG: hypothetical protein PVJ49_10025 [Acidobacteriota bacterium]|jgi:hypothetical protein
MRQGIIRGFVVLAALGLFVPAAQAQEIGYAGGGFRVGLNTYPNQFQFGGQANLGEFVEHLRFQPSFTVGLGDNRVIWMGNIDAAYHFPVEGNWSPYAGAGLGIGIEDRDGADNVDVKAGLNILGGIEWGERYRYFFEARTQVGTSFGDFTVLFGMNF